MKEQLETVKILDVSITTSKEEDILEHIITGLKTQDKKLSIFTPNPEIIMYAQKHPEFKAVLNSASVNLPDGVGVVIAGKLLGRKLQGRIPGVSFMEKLCKESVKKGVSIGLLGGQAGVAEEVAECLVRKYPGLQISFVAPEWDDKGFERADKIKDLRFKNKEDHKSLGILFVAFGFPKQEQWIHDNLDKIPFQAAMGVGGAFDFLSGRVSRAPHVIQAAGFEWLYRLIRQPWRAKRQLALIEFGREVLKERIKEGR